MRGDLPDMYYFYGHYYAVQAMWTAGGDYWKEWFPAIRDELLHAQQPDGSWQRPDLQPLRHRDGVHHLAGAQQLPADLAKMNKFLVSLLLAVVGIAR